jgi:outer membrane translocation and assembly module TamA
LPNRPDLPTGFRIGAPAESGVIVAAVGAAVDGWRSQGNAKAKVTAQDVVADHASATLSADIQIAPGPVLRFGRLTVTGQDRMREGRILKIAGLPEGERFDPAELDRAATRLRRTGVFTSVSLAEDAAITPPDYLGITATVVEQKPRRYSLGAELGSLDGLKLSGTWLHRNLMGGAERLELWAEVTNIGSGTSGVDYTLGAKLDRPATFSPDTNLGLAVEFGHLDEADFFADVASTSVTLSHVFSDSLTGRAGLSYSYAAITDAVGDATYRDLALPLGLSWDRRDSKTDAKRGFRDRRKQTLFIDARKMGTLIDRVHRELTNADLDKITSTYHAWRGDASGLQLKLKTSTTTSAYADVAGFCKSATTAEIAAHGHVLTPGRYVGAEEVEDDGDPFEEKMPRLVAELHAQFAESAKLEKQIKERLTILGF